jgi:hypothetical protein
MQAQIGMSQETKNITSKSNTAGNFVFLLLAFPFGLLYFLLVVIGFSVGIGTAIISVGIPILFATFTLVHGMAAMERGIAANLLRIDFPRPRQRDGERTFMQRFVDYLRDPLTWTSIIYMILKLPLGIISFILIIVLPIVSATITLMPIAYLVNLFVNSILLTQGIHTSDLIIPNFVEIHNTFDLTRFDLIIFISSFVGVPVGIALCFASRAVFNGLAKLSGELARALLSPSRD